MLSRRTRFREWYVDRYCNDNSVQQIQRIQNTLPRYQGVITKYFEFLSIFGETPFYTFFLPVMFWIGMPHEAAIFCVMMSVTLIFINNLKDFGMCPRPPCPPLRRAGTHSHSLEYGLPSSHTGLGTTCTFHICYICAQLWPHHALLIWLCGVSFIFQTAVSRMYLGLHWLGDLVGGCLVACVALLLQEACIKSLVHKMIVSESFPWYLVILAHVFSVVHFTPREPCPCYEDTARFNGAALGSSIGAWVALAHPLLQSRLAMKNEDKPMQLLNWTFYVDAVLGVAIIAGCKAVTSEVMPRVLKPLYLFMAGARRDSVPRVFQGVYLTLCTVAGVLLTGNRGTSVVLSLSTGEVHEVDDAVNSSAQQIEAGQGQDSALPSGKVLLVWSPKVHKYWWLWDIHTKVAAYCMVGYAATVFYCYMVAYLGHP